MYSSILRTTILFTAIVLISAGCSKYYTPRSKPQAQSTFGNQAIVDKYANASSPQRSQKKKGKAAVAGTANPYVEAAKRERVKRDYDMKKPQYSDPSYFGHKKKPKIRKRGKRKLCKECGIVH